MSGDVGKCSLSAIAGFLPFSHGNTFKPANSGISKANLSSASGYKLWEWPLLKVPRRNLDPWNAGWKHLEQQV